ncbi:Uncharacterised protein [Mycobacteroides abscessus subsp. massiliense]|nr:Uncharacterised protein [Mycobacteroides abscessus subsp. massiliense]
MSTPIPMAAKYDSTTDPTRYRGATIARSNTISVSSTTMSVAAMMNWMSCW